MRVAFALLLVACGTDSGSGGAYTSIDQVTAAYQAASCTHLVACRVFADQATCTSTNLHDSSFYLSPQTIAHVLSGKVRYNGNIVAACLDKVATRSCTLNGLDHRETFSACIANVLSGTLAAGESCTNNLECISQQCSSPCSVDQCCPVGTCIGSVAPVPSPIQIGQPCTTQATCVTGAFCNSQTATCTAYKSIGAPCNDPSECGDALDCSGSPTICSPRARRGESCATMACGDEGTYCNSLTRLCTDFALVGASCADALAAECTPYELCNSQTLTCTTYPTLGQSCQETGLCNELDSQCSGNQICTTLGQNGASCVSNLDCASQYCNPTHVCATYICP